MTATATRPIALVTGASSGIGLELARQFGQGGFDLVIAADDEAELATAAQDLRSTGATVEPVPVDLATADGVEELHRRATAGGRPVAALALNAGIGSGGPFHETSLEHELKLVDLNVRGTVHLAKLVVREMAARREGRILVTSSIASTQPGTFNAVYNASKSFDQSFALALRSELKDLGVSVTSLMPGPTDTEFFERGNLTDTRLGATNMKDDPADVARQGYEALMQGRERVVAASLMTKIQGYSGRFLPDSAKALMHKVLARPGSAN